jgi:hypothetical protein
MNSINHARAKEGAQRLTQFAGTLGDLTNLAACYLDLTVKQAELKSKIDIAIHALYEIMSYEFKTSPNKFRDTARDAMLEINKGGDKMKDDKTVEILQKFFYDCACNNLEVSSLTIGDGFFDRLASKIDINHIGFYESEFIFNTSFGQVKIIREHKICEHVWSMFTVNGGTCPINTYNVCSKCGAKR